MKEYKVRCLLRRNDRERGRNTRCAVYSDGTTERKALGVYTVWTERRYSDDVVYKVTRMVMQQVCDVFIVG